MEKKPCLIIINGKPATGKSYFLHKLSIDLDVPYLSRDEIKESLFNELGIADSEWSRKLGGASYSLLFIIFEKLLRSKKSFIIESNFNPTQHSENLKAKLKLYGFDAIEIFLDADPSILLSRFRTRWESGERHRGHADNERFEELELRLKNTADPLNLTEKIIRIETSDFSTVDYNSLKNNLMKLI